MQFIQPDAIEFIVNSLRAEFPDKYLIAEYNPGDYQSAAAWWTFTVSSDSVPPGIWAVRRHFNLLSGNNVTGLLLKRIGGFSDPNPWHQLAYLTGSHDQIYGG